MATKMTVAEVGPIEFWPEGTWPILDQPADRGWAQHQPELQMAQHDDKALADDAPGVLRWRVEQVEELTRLEEQAQELEQAGYPVERYIFRMGQYDERGYWQADESGEMAICGATFQAGIDRGLGPEWFEIWPGEWNADSLAGEMLHSETEGARQPDMLTPERQARADLQRDIALVLQADPDAVALRAPLGGR